MGRNLWRRLPTRLVCCLSFFVLCAGALITAQPCFAAFGFGPPVALNSNAGSDSRHDSSIHIATDGLGTWIAAWVYGTSGPSAETDILYSRSTDNGATWSPQAYLNVDWDTDWRLDTVPNVATDGSGTWIIAWHSHEDLGGMYGNDLDIFFRRSTDNGVTWSPQEALNTDAPTDGDWEMGVRLATDRSGNWVAVWMCDDTDGGLDNDEDIFSSTSSDNGVTWAPPAVLNSNATTDGWSDHDLYPVVSTDCLGNWLVVWQAYDDLGGTVGTDDDIFISRSTDNGSTWSPVQTLNTNAGSDTGHDDNAWTWNDGAGTWLAAWDSNEDLEGTAGTDRDVFYSISADGGLSWSPPAVLNTNASSDSGGDICPLVKPDGTGGWLAVWWSTEDLGGTAGTDRDIFVSRSMDNGNSWSAPQCLTAHHESDSVTDWGGTLCTDGLGHWIVSWHSEDDLGGTIGSDDDILYTTSSSVPVLNWELY